MSNVYIRSLTDAGLLIVESTQKVESPVILDKNGNQVSAPVLCEKEENGRRILSIDAANLKKWSPDTPELYTFTAKDIKERFGFCELRTFANTAVLLNGKRCYLRGYIRGITAHEHPNMTGGSLKDAAVKNIRQAKKYGFNLVRFHSTIPTAEFVEAADEEGLLIHMEIGFAYEYDDQGNKKGLALDNANWRETINRYRNHPSVAIFCIGNEMHNSGHQPKVLELYKEGKKLAPGKLILDNSGWGEFDRSSADILSQHIAYYFPYKSHRDMFTSDECWHMNGSSKDTPMQEKKADVKIRRYANPVKPVLAHEAIHYIEIPDYDALNKKFDAFAEKVGAEYLEANEIKKPRYMQGFHDLVMLKGIADKLPEYRAASEHFKKFGIKTYMERLRLSGLAGFEMLQFADCFKYENKNGIVDCFDDDKYIDAKWMREFNSDTVLLTDLPEECFFDNEEIKLPIYLSNYSGIENTFGSLKVCVKNISGETELYNSDNIFAVDGVQKLIDIEFTLPRINQAEEYTVSAEFEAAGISCRNSWKIWRYPADNKITSTFDSKLENKKFADWITSRTADDAKESKIVLYDRLCEELFSDLETGKTAILFYHRDNPGQKFYWPGSLERFKPCIWDRGSNLGGIIRNDILQKSIGCGKFFDAPMYELIEAGYKLNLDHFPGKMTELISGVDKPVRDRMKGLIHGVKDYLPDDTLRNFCHCGIINVGNGKLIVCTFNTAHAEKPSASSFFTALLNNAMTFEADNRIDARILADYLANAPLVTEDVMNHFWEIDNKPVEDTLFWEESGINLGKKK